MTCIFVEDAIVMGVVVFNGVCVCVAAGGMKVVPVVAGMAVRVANSAPGVRKRLIQTGSVRMEGATGSMNPLGRRVRKSLFGSSFESIFVFSFQRGVKCSAH